MSNPIIFARIKKSGDVYTVQLRQYQTLNKFTELKRAISYKSFTTREGAIIAAKEQGFRPVKMWEDAREVVRSQRYRAGKKWHTAENS